MRRNLIRAAVVVALLGSAVVPATSERARESDYAWRNVEIVGGGYVPGIVFNHERARPRLRPHRHRRRLPLERARRSRWVPLLDWVGLGRLEPHGRRQPGHRPRRSRPPLRRWPAPTRTPGRPSNGAILRSTRPRPHLARTNLPFKSGGNMPGRNMGERLVIDPNRNSILYLGARSGNGLWRSTDYGATWSRVTSFPAIGTYVAGPERSERLPERSPSASPGSSSTRARARRQRATQTIYVGVADLGTSIYRSTDGGRDLGRAARPARPASCRTTPCWPRRASSTSPTTTRAARTTASRATCGSTTPATAVWTMISPDPVEQHELLVRLRRPRGGRAEPGHADGGGAQPLVARHHPLAQHRRRARPGRAIWDWGPWPTRILHYVQDIIGRALAHLRRLSPEPARGHRPSSAGWWATSRSTPSTRTA